MYSRLESPGTRPYNGPEPYGTRPCSVSESHVTRERFGAPRSQRRSQPHKVAVLNGRAVAQPETATIISDGRGL